MLAIKACKKKFSQPKNVNLLHTYSNTTYREKQSGGNLSLKLTLNIINTQACKLKKLQVCINN